MKKATVILMVIIIAIIIVFAIGMVPLMMYVNSVNSGFESIAQGSEYSTNLNNIVSSTGIADSIKNSANIMDNTINKTLKNMTKADFRVCCYLIVVIAIMLVIFGVYFIKNQNCKNYVGTSLIVAACMLLAFTVIIGVSVLK